MIKHWKVKAVTRFLFKCWQYLIFRFVANKVSLVEVCNLATWQQIPLRFIFRGCSEVCAPGEQTHLYPSFILRAISKCLMKTTPDRNDFVLYQPKLAVLTRRYCQHSHTHTNTHTKRRREKCYWCPLGAACIIDLFEWFLNILSLANGLFCQRRCEMWLQLERKQLCY